MILLRRLMDSPIRLVVLTFIVASFIILLAACRMVWPFTTDDSYITFRYSANLADGMGPTFNRIPPRAEGYTSFLWMLVMTIPHLFGAGVLTFSKLAGLLFVAGTMLWMIVFHAWRGMRAASWFRLMAAAVACLLFSMLPETAVHAVSGMETAMYTFLLTGLVVLAYFGMQNRQWALNGLPVIALLTGLTRPEGNLTAAVLLAAVLLSLPRMERRGFLIRILALYILPGALYFLWRWSYFGVALPLPFYVKSGGISLVGWPSVLEFLIFLMANFGLYIGLGLLGERLAVRVLLLTVLPNLFFFLFNYPIMGYDYRFLYPLLPAFLILASLGLAVLLEKASSLSKAGRSWYLPGWVIALVVLVFSSQNIPRMQGVFDHKIDYAQGMVRNHLAIGHVLNMVPHSAVSPVLVVNDAGAMPYFSGWHTIDAGGLNDPDIALNRVEPVGYIYSHQPEVVVLMSNDLAAFKNDSKYAQDLYNSAVSSGLEVVGKSTFYQQDTIWIFARPGSEAAKQLRAHFTQ